MIALQILSKILATSDNSIVEDNLLTEEYFVGYENEYNFIQEHLKEYGNVPDKATFLAKFPDIELVEVTESDRYLVDTVREEYLYYKSVPVIQKAADLLKISRFSHIPTPCVPRDSNCCQCFHIPLNGMIVTFFCCV